MCFVGQVALPETKLTRALFTWGMNVYLFWKLVNGQDCFKLVEQGVGSQSAEDHYATE
jgi:hypothetical protein